MKKEIWDWLHPKLCRSSANNSSIKASLKADCDTGRHARSISAQRGASSFSPFGCWSDTGRMSGVDVDHVSESEAVSGGMEGLAIGLLGQQVEPEDINGAEEALSDRPSVDIQEYHVDSKMIQSQQPSDNGRIKEIYCRFNLLADYLISRRKRRHDAFNAFNSREKNVESELESMSGQRSKKIFGWKMLGPTSFQPKLQYKKGKQAFLKMIPHIFETKKSDGRGLVHTPLEVLDASEARTSEQVGRNCVHSTERNGDQMLSVPTNKEEIYSQLGATDYRITTDSDYVVLEW